MADPIAAAIAANRDAIDTANNAAANITAQQAEGLASRIGAYVATEEKSGPLVYENLDGLCKDICNNTPNGDGTLPETIINFLPNEDKTNVTVALVETFSEMVADAIIARARALRFLACRVNDAASVPKIASAVAGHTVLHAPIPEGEFDPRDKAALTRHANSWLTSFGICMSTIQQAGHNFVPGSFRLIASSLTPRNPGSSNYTTLTLIINIANGPHQGPTRPPHGPTILSLGPYPWDPLPVTPLPAPPVQSEGHGVPPLDYPRQGVQRRLHR